MIQRLTWVTGVALALVACGPSPEEQETVRRWLLCEECNEGEQEAVVALGDRVADPLAEALRGPPGEGVENVRRQAELMSARLASPATNRARYVNRFVDNYVATYQTRAAIALGSIGTPRTRAILLDALRTDSTARPDVLRAIGASAGVALAVSAGDNQSAPADSFVRINPRIVVRDTMTGAPLANVRVLFRVDSGAGIVLGAAQHTGTDGSTSVRWQLGGGLDQVNILSATAVGQTVQFRAMGRGADPLLVFVVPPTGAHVAIPITPPVRVAVQDPWGGVIGSFTGAVTMTGVGQVLFSVDTLVAGVAEFSGLVFTSPGTGIRLKADVAGAGPATSAPFDVLP